MVLNRGETLCDSRCGPSLAVGHRMLVLVLIIWHLAVLCHVQRFVDDLRNGLDLSSELLLNAMQREPGETGCIMKAARGV